MISGSAIVCTPYAIDVMHRLTPGIAHAQTIQRPTRGAPSGRIAEHRTRVAGKMLQTCPLRRKRWLFNTVQRDHGGHMALRSLGRPHSIPSDNDGVSQGWCASLRGLSSLYNVAHG